MPNPATHRGWLVFAACATFVVALHAVIFLTLGTGNDAVRLMLRLSARTSAIIFFLAFVARPLHQLHPTPANHWLALRQPYFLLSLAFSHTAHLGMILLAYQRGLRDPFDLGTLAGGGTGYLFIYALAATAFPPRAMSSARAARRNALHTVALYYLGFIFTVTYLGRTLGESWRFAPFLLLLLSLFALDIAARLRTRRAEVALSRVTSA